MAAIAFGAITMRRRTAARNWVRADELRSPTGDHILRVFAAEDFLDGGREQGLGDERFALVPDHRLEQRLAVRDGGWQIEASTLTLVEGLGFQGTVDPALARVLGALDGHRTLREAVAVAKAELGLGAAEKDGFVATAERMARTLYRLGFLLRGGDPAT